MGNEVPNIQELELNRWRRLSHDLRALPLPQAGKFLWNKVSKGWRMQQAERSMHRQIAALELDLGAALNARQGLAEFLTDKFSRLVGFPLLPAQKSEVVRVLHDHFPGWVTRCINQANQICDNQISILGHKVCVEQSPAWHKDHLSGVEWPIRPSATRPNPVQNQGSDIKFVWELSRFHHGVTLGRAFALTRDERFAEKFVSHFSSWRTANPTGIGPNWTCAMEVAIRAANLLWAGSLVASSKAFDPAVQEAFTKSLLAHGSFIYHHLEYNERVMEGRVEPVNGNHYLSDLVGLLYIGTAFPDYQPAAKWRDFAVRELFREIHSQVDDQGVHAEYSPGYHRLVLEMVLGCLILLERQSIPVPLEIREKVVKMVDFIRHYRKPSGAVPLVRDLDSGRFCILGEDELTSHDHVLALGAVFFDQPALFPGELFEDCVWHLGSSVYGWKGRHFGSLSVSVGSEKEGGRTSTSDDVDLPQSTHFKQSGFVVMRHESHQMFAVCAPKGMRGYCGHTHNDFLSFELEAFGRTFLTDCGSYVYSQSPEWRNRFRSTRSHNTLIVDGQEQNRFPLSELFEIDSRVRPEVRHWSSNPEQDRLDATYTMALPDGTKVTHERRFVFLKERALWLIRDRVTGSGEHTIETRFHFTEGINLMIERVFQPSTDHRSLNLYHTGCASGPNLFLMATGDVPFTGTVETAWVSRSYASKTEIRVLCFAVKTLLPFEQRYVLAPVRNEANPAKFRVDDLNEILRTAEEELATETHARPSSRNPARLK